MSFASRLKSVARKATATLAALATAATLATVGAGTASAQGHRDWLRPDATGHCDWDGVAFWVQRCDVWSPSNGRNITVQIQPAQRAGNAGLYMLDGARAPEAYNAWAVDARAMEKFVDNNITLVMPVGGAGTFYTDWAGPQGFFGGPTPKWETFLTQELPAYLQQHFGVSPTNNSIAGLSMGATAAMNLAANHPQQFRQALSYSGYLTTTLPGAFALMGLVVWDTAQMNVNNMYGSIMSPRRAELDPYTNMEGLRGKDIYVSAASGVWGPGEIGQPINGLLVGSALEASANASTRYWEPKARAIGLNVTSDYPLLGIHNWQQWDLQLAKTRGRILDVMNAW
ncbi:alpha/beta hydrolase [Corynebacterium pelargi]|uniref:Diacylglycerol acyltransferase/mycolyltransferase Ag85C n=1 Tax=Corynebacterium pelargi TaxID=1471400 RepID=A0A410W6I4_9CORY|nr:alpha/beta hydrolase family protein [Corynebacterium pelargi]QAU51486.1 Diacylglycerol acyltransferase/mycolyltransferase Ag85C precursor [Corynebacterium pelargi]GGG79503.1 esterase [Corynebacterium pelargi]